MKLLYVEDDPNQQLMLTRLLKGYEVKAVRYPSDALALAPDFAPQAILLDIHLPEMTGFALVERLRAIPQTQYSFMVALTADNMYSSQTYLKAGFDAYLLKPFSRQALLDLLQDIQTRLLD
jgi:CheY-like chemotaxis protein